MLTTNIVAVALGANSTGCFGEPIESFQRAITLLAEKRIAIVSQSGLFRTTPVSQTRQPAFLNAVILIETTLTPARLLRFLKQIERRTGRRSRGRNGPRPLDLDILAYRTCIVGWSKAKPRHCRTSAQRSLHGWQRKSSQCEPVRRSRRPWLVLPHPLLHLRRFVLEPLVDIAPHWYHPVLGLQARELLHALPPSHMKVERVLDSGWILCDTSPE